jgi:hypothetical protein
VAHSLCLKGEMGVGAPLDDSKKARASFTIFPERCLGFTGSAGLAVILDKDAALWTDSRFFSQVVISRFLPPVSFTSRKD